MTSLKTIENKLTRACYDYVFARDKSECQKCGRVIGGHSRHPSHVIPKSRSKWLRWDHRNIKTLCFYHHIHWWHQFPTESGEWFKETFPQRYRYLEKNKHIKLNVALRENGVTYREWLNNWIEFYETNIGSFS